MFTKRHKTTSKTEHVPNTIIESIVAANSVRKDFIAQSIIDKEPNTVGVYRLVMKQDQIIGEVAIQGIMKRIKSKGIKVMVYEPAFKEDTFFGSKVINNLDYFKKNSDIILLIE